MLRGAIAAADLQVGSGENQGLLPFAETRGGVAVDVPQCLPFGSNQEPQAYTALDLS